MGKLFENIKSLIETLEGQPFIEVVECAWCYVEGSDDIVYYNLDSNLEELYEGNGSTYSCEIKNSWVQDGCVFVNGDIGCGETVTYVFKENLEVDWDDLEEMFNGEGDE